MKRRPAMMTRYACKRAVLVESRVKVEALQSGICVSLFYFILDSKSVMSCCESCLFLKLLRSQVKGIQQFPIIIIVISLIQLIEQNGGSILNIRIEKVTLLTYKETVFLYNLYIGCAYIYMTQTQEKGLSFKVILIGDSGTGKTSLIHQYIHGTFKDEYQVTVGVDFSSKIVIVDEVPVQLQIWDTCGQDIYKAITNNFYRGAAAVFLVYAIDNRQSFDRLRQWLEEFYEKGSNNAFIFVIATKCDLERAVESQEGFQFLKSINGTFFIETSAKESIKVDQLFHKAAQTMYKFYSISKDYRDLVKPQRMTMSVIPGYNRITLTGSVVQEEKTKKKCC